ncbi:GtrA family protein [Sphingobium aquiterrae]|uniref:GtrA family protein n=1 Tax=Sphingobium aquiterrae TaxID=2038656 RepID=UPI003017EFB8
MTWPAERMWRRTYARYLAASATALAVDGGLFLLLLNAGMPAAVASVLGYGAGIGAHWLLSSRSVFIGHIAYSREGRARQKALFLGSAVAGLAITAAIVGIGDMLGLDPRIAKLVAVAVSFQATYMLRKSVVFACR